MNPQSDTPVTASSSVQRAFLVLSSLTVHGTHVSMRELAARVGLPRSTVHRICQALATEGILTYDDVAKRYGWGDRLVAISRAVLEGSELRRLARQEMQAMVARANEGAQLILFDRETPAVVIADFVDCTHPVRYHPALNVPLVAHAGATGKSILAFASDEEIEAVIAQGLEPQTPRTITDRDALLRDLAAIRRAGVSVSHGERTPGSVGVGAPIFQHDGAVVGALNMTVPEFRSSEATEALLKELVTRGAERISRAMGLPRDVPYPPRRD